MLTESDLKYAMYLGMVKKIKLLLNIKNINKDYLHYFFQLY